MFVNYGYYITSPCRCPEYLQGFSQWILTASGCICDSEPEVFLCMSKDGKRKEEYRKRLGMEKQVFNEYSEAAMRLFRERRLDADGRFLLKKDADEVYRRYFYSRAGDYRVIGISLEEMFLPVLEAEIRPEPAAKLQAETLRREEAQIRPSDRKFLGFDILGWDISGFHTYLCNSLQKELMKQFELKPGRFGLLENSIVEVRAFADAIQNKGEPVVWIPFAVFDDTPVRDGI